jgi:hypothetical protein
MNNPKAPAAPPKPDELDLQLRRISAALDYLQKLEPWAKELVLDLERSLQEYFKNHVSEVTPRGSSLSFRFWGLGIWARTELQVGPGPSFVPRARLAAYAVTDLEGLEQLRPIGRPMELLVPLPDPKERASQKAAFSRQFLVRVLVELMEANGVSDRISSLTIALDSRTAAAGL